MKNLTALLFLVLTFKMSAQDKQDRYIMDFAYYAEYTDLSGNGKLDLKMSHPDEGSIFFDLENKKDELGRDIILTVIFTSKDYIDQVITCYSVEELHYPNDTENTYFAYYSIDIDTCVRIQLKDGIVRLDHKLLKGKLVYQNSLLFYLKDDE